MTSHSLHKMCVSATSTRTHIVAGMAGGRRVACTPMNWKKKIGERIKAARTAKGLSLEELSERTGRVLSASRISNYEQGTRLCKPQQAAILAPHLGVTASHLQCLDARGEEDDEMSPEAKRLLRGWEALPENERMAYLRRIETLALAYRDPVPDENLAHRAAPTAKVGKRLTGKKPSRKPG